MTVHITRAGTLVRDQGQLKSKPEDAHARAAMFVQATTGSDNCISRAVVSGVIRDASEEITVEVRSERGGGGGRSVNVFCCSRVH